MLCLLPLRLSLSALTMHLMLQRLVQGAQEVAEEVAEAFVLAEALESVEAPLCLRLCPVERGSTPRARLPSSLRRTSNM